MHVAGHMNARALDRTDLAEMALSKMEHPPAIYMNSWVLPRGMRQIGTINMELSASERALGLGRMNAQPQVAWP